MKAFFLGVAGSLLVWLVDLYMKKHFKQLVSNLPWDFLLYLTYLVILLLLIYKLIKFLKQKDFFLWLKQKPLELYYLFSNKRERYIDTPNQFECFELHQKYFDLAELCKSFICYNQGWLAQFSFLAGEIHKNIKIEYNKGDQCDLQILKSNCKNIDKQLDYYLDTVFKESTEFILKYFERRSPKEPRICLKIVNKNNEVDAMFRSSYEYVVKYKIEENKGFYHVYNTGKPFMCNDIPKAVYKGNYYNFRIIDDKAKLYYKDDNQNEKKWIDCWEKNIKEDGEKVDPSVESCYKSTLIIPLTLINNKDLTREFSDHFRIPNSSNSNQRAIYGFLCFDHQDTNYFKKDIDCRLGYVFADILSVYLIHMMVYTEFSETYNNACKLFTF